jgi:hypothetical protein
VFRLTPVRKEFDEAGVLCAQINLFGFVDEEVFLTKSGDLGVILGIEGVDYECLDPNAIENLTHRPTAAFRIFDEKCRVYQYPDRSGVDGNEICPSERSRDSIAGPNALRRSSELWWSDGQTARRTEQNRNAFSVRPRVLVGRAA